MSNSDKRKLALPVWATIRGIVIFAIVCAVLSSSLPSLIKVLAALILVGAVLEVVHQVALRFWQFIDDRKKAT